jgi:hypothetical protein
VLARHERAVVQLELSVPAPLLPPFAVRHLVLQEQLVQVIRLVWMIRV